MKKLLITGGCGFVGRHFAHHYLSQNDEVTVVDDLSTGIATFQWPTPVPLTGRLIFRHMDTRSIPYRFENSAYDLIIHCATVVGGRVKIEQDPLAIASDLAIDAEFIQWLVETKTRAKVIYFSSSAVYPVELQQEKSHVALSEPLVDLASTRIGMPDLTHGWAKLTGEYLAQYAAKQYGLDIVIYRPFSGYGEDQSLDYPFPAIVRRILSGENPVSVWGSGRQTRDWIHIDDIVSAVVATRDLLRPGEALNLGSGTGTAFYDLAGLVGDVIGRPVSIKPDLTKPAGVFHRVADTYKLSQVYSKPLIPLEEGIKRVASFLTKRPNSCS